MSSTSTVTRNKDQVSFQYVLHDPKTMPYLLDYLCSTQKVAMLFFWLEAEEYKMLVGKPSELCSRANDIHAKYLCDDSPSYIVPMIDQQEGFKQTLTDLEFFLVLLNNGEPTLDMFSALQDAVEYQIETELWPGFRSSSSFRALVDGLRDNTPVSLSEVLEDPSLYDFFELFWKAEYPDDIGTCIFFKESIECDIETVHEDSFIPQRSSNDSIVDRKKLTSRSSSYVSATLEINDASSKKGNSRHSSLMDLLPGSASAQSSTIQIQNERQDLLEMHRMAKEIFEKFLTPNSVFEATRVSSAERAAISQTLDKVGHELGSSEKGKLASVGGLTSVNTVFNMLSGLRQTLETCFLPAQREIRKWIEEECFPRFIESESYAALVIAFEEKHSELHMARHRMIQMVHGFHSSSDMLIFAQSRRTFPNIRDDIPGVNEPVETCHRRSSSYLWSHVIQAPEVIVELDLDTIRDTEPDLVGHSEEMFTPAFFDHGNVCFGSTVQLNNVLVEHHTDTSGTLKPIKSDDPKNPIMLVINSEGKQEYISLKDLIPPDVASYVLPSNLQVRMADPLAKLLEDTNTSVHKSTRRRSYSDVEPRSVFVLCPPRPLEQDFTRITYTELLDENYKEIDESHIISEVVTATKILDYDEFGMPTCITNLKPETHMHAFTIPCKQFHHPSTNSTTRHWHGVCLTGYKLVKVECEQAMSPDNTSKETDGKEYSEIGLRLIKRAGSGLGINLKFTRDKYIVIQDFLPRSDGSLNPAVSLQLVKPNDALISVNGVDVAGRPFDDVVADIKDVNGELNCVFARNWDSSNALCLFCDRPSCTALYAYVPYSKILMSYQNPCFSRMFSMLRRYENDYKQTRDYENNYENSKLVGDWIHPPSLTDVPMGIMLKYLSKPTIVDALANLLMGRSMVMVSDSTTLLANVGACLKALMWPFVWSNMYVPVMPAADCAKLIGKRKRQLLFAQQNPTFNLAPFFIGVCTLDIGLKVVDNSDMTSKNNNIADWMDCEQDSLRPLDRISRLRSLKQLFEQGTMLLDIDSDILDIPKPTTSDKLYNTRQEQSAEDALFKRTLNSPRKFNIFRDTRLRTASSSSIVNSNPACFRNPSFPEKLRKTVFSSWAQHKASGKYNEGYCLLLALQDIYATMLQSYRQYYLSYPDPEQKDSRIFAFNWKAFLCNIPTHYRAFLKRFMKTQAFASFLVESIYTRCRVFQYQAPPTGVLTIITSIDK